MSQPATSPFFQSAAEAVEAWDLERAHLHHDLRAKAGVLLRLSDILLVAGGEPLSERQRVQVAMIRRASLDLLEIIEHRLPLRQDPA